MWKRLGSFLWRRSHLPIYIVLHRNVGMNFLLLLCFDVRGKRRRIGYLCVWWLGVVFVVCKCALVYSMRLLYHEGEGPLPDLWLLVMHAWVHEMVSLFCELVICSENIILYFRSWPLLCLYQLSGTNDSIGLSLLFAAV